MQCRLLRPEMLPEIGLVFLALFLALYWYITKNFGYFAKHGIKEEPGTFPFGSDASWGCWLKGKSFLKIFDESAKKYKNEKMHGMYSLGQRNLVITDIDLGKQILIKDADHFTDRMVIGTLYKDSTAEVEKIFSLMLTNMTGEEWKKVETISHMGVYLLFIPFHVFSDS